MKNLLLRLAAWFLGFDQESDVVLVWKKVKS